MLLRLRMAFLFNYQVEHHMCKYVVDRHEIDEEGNSVDLEKIAGGKVAGVTHCFVHHLWPAIAHE